MDTDLLTTPDLSDNKASDDVERPRSSVTIDTVSMDTTSSTEHVKPSKDEVDWATLKRTEDSELLDASQSPVDPGFIRYRLESRSARKSLLQVTNDQGQNSVHGPAHNRLSQSSNPSRRASLQQIRRSVVNSVTCEPPSATSRHIGLGHARNESKEILLTDLELWTALVSDYTQTAVRLPTLTSRKIRAGVPQPLRGLVWQAMSGARDTHLEGLYETLSVESTPFEKVIGRDLARTFPQVEMFKQEDGAGQLDLGKVLRAFSLYDAEVGYCQGLGFIVAPLLMNMGHSEAFCVLVRMMEGYELRSMFTPTLSGLKLRLYQFEHYLDQLAPGIASHLKQLDIAPAMYVSQWFLSLFAVTCPLDTLHRIYDLVLSEGGPETIMRLAITLLIKNQEQIMTLEMEEVLHLLLSSDLWSAYDQQDDLLMNDVVSFSASITPEDLANLEKQFENALTDTPIAQVKGLQSIASSFLGRINPSRLFSGSYSVTGLSEPSSAEMARTPSKMSSMTAESTSTRSSSTENPEASSNSSFSRSSTVSLKKQTESLEKENHQLNQQIEDLIDALTEAHREVAVKNERSDRHLLTLDEFKSLCTELLDALALPAVSAVDHDACNPPNKDSLIAHWTSELASKLVKEPLSASAQLSAEKIKFLESQLDDRNIEVGRLRSSLQSVRIALEATQKEKTRVEKALSEVRQQKKDKHQSNLDGGIREFKLSRPAAGMRTSSQTRIETTNQTAFAKGFRRASTFNTTASSPEESPPAPSSPDLVTKEVSSTSTTGMTAHEEELDTLRLELVQAKAAIAIAQQEAEEAKYALRMLRNVTSGGKGHVKRISVGRAETAPAGPEATISIPTKQATTTPGTPATPGPTSWFWGRK